MSEIIYKYSKNDAQRIIAESKVPVCQLEHDDYQVFIRHLELCGQRPISRETWDEIHNEGIVYFGIFINGNMVSRACIEIISQDEREIADVRTAHQYRGHGYASQLCQFLLEQILAEGKTPTIRTGSDDLPMQKVIEKLGFTSV